MSEGAGALPEVTEELLAAIEFRYAEPRCCRVCGSPLHVTDSRGMKMTCTSDAASPLSGKHEAAGATWKQALDHYGQSTMYDPPDGDLRVLALVAEVRRLRGKESPAPMEAWKLEGYDTFSAEDYPLGDVRMPDGSTLDGLEPSYDSYEAALAGARKRLADLERTQPAASSSGQAGIQDQVRIVHPDGRRERVHR